MAVFGQVPSGTVALANGPADGPELQQPGEVWVGVLAAASTIRYTSGAVRGRLAQVAGCATQKKRWHLVETGVLIRPFELTPLLYYAGACARA